MKIIQIMLAPDGIEITYDGYFEYDEENEDDNIYTTNSQVIAFALTDDSEVYPMVIENGKLEIAIGAYNSNLYIVKERNEQLEYQKLKEQIKEQLERQARGIKRL